MSRYRRLEFVKEEGDRESREAGGELEKRLYAAGLCITRIDINFPSRLHFPIELHRLRDANQGRPATGVQYRSSIALATK